MKTAFLITLFLVLASSQVSAREPIFKKLSGLFLSQEQASEAVKNDVFVVFSQTDIQILKNLRFGYSAASANGATEIKVRPLKPLRKVTLPSTVAKIV